MNKKVISSILQQRHWEERAALWLNSMSAKTLLLKLKRRADWRK